MRLSDYDFQLPERLIACYPKEKRDESRLLLVDRKKESWEATVFKELPDFLNQGDCLVLNNTRVYPARLMARSVLSNRSQEFLLLQKLGENSWKVLFNKSKRTKVNEKFLFRNGIVGELTEKLEAGFGVLTFEHDVSTIDLAELGDVALPPYILKLRNINNKDKDAYQTVYGELEGSVAAPTAGLHFTEPLLNRLKKKELF